VGKSGVLEHKSDNISETHKDKGKVLYCATYTTLITYHHHHHHHLLDLFVYRVALNRLGLQPG